VAKFKSGLLSQHLSVETENQRKKLSTDGVKAKLLNTALFNTKHRR
jgi:hypothetical protein